ncbi:hypothetical protein [Pedobacter sp. MC2016-24]|uniref:hypothetical protein n=1 Tax=Pedobacter sp. MC2016-24 TaxID=2780090 RepID=UPI00187FABCF|nr:hypothetical protein [Pedobacter sp. MC2016-24]MBE9601369.1 hypothetical protein [Pedobacter sp. MC2016-24]
MIFNVLKIVMGFAMSVFCASLQAQEVKHSVHLVWKKQPVKGTVDVENGRLKNIMSYPGHVKLKANHFSFTKTEAAGITIELDQVNNEPGPGATLIHVQTSQNPFSFLWRDVKSAFPIFLPELGVAVLHEEDRRTYEAVADDIASRHLKTKVQAIELAEEASFLAVEKKVRSLKAPTWLGISRDFRIFEINQNLTDAQGGGNTISPKHAVSPLRLAETKNAPVSYFYTLGRGIGPLENTARYLENGSLPILHSILRDDDITYHSTSFVALEQQILDAANVKGTYFLVADQYSAGHMLNKSQEEEAKQHADAALNSTEETVYFQQTEIVNTGKVPRYAWFMNPRSNYPYTYDAKTGYSAYADNRIFCIAKLNGLPFPNQEMAILLQPGEKATFEFYIPHSPISAQRAADLSKQSFAAEYIATKQYWVKKLDNAAKIQVPEKRVNDMIQAGLLHLDLITYGNEPKGTLAPNIGVYSPIGTESAPIIQFYASMGLSDIAKRSLNYFLDKQHDNGFIQNFNGYMVETGAALWTIGEYYRYTGDEEWIRNILPKLIKSCNFLIDWRNQNKIDSLKNKGYGMISGKVADPEDHFHQFMLNGYAYMGLSRMAEILARIDPMTAKKLAKEAREWRADIRASFFQSMSRSPVVPLGDGTWCQTAPPWAEGTGPRALYLKKENFWSHGTFTVPDGLLGPLYLVFCEVLDVGEPAASALLHVHSELFLQGNSMFSQPYYSRHNWLQVKRGMVKPFLDTYYHTFAGLADRETYTFWEHFHQVSPHKTHEEAWFLMETRWMLYLEQGDTLQLLKTIPRAWMEAGKEVVLSDVQSYFGKVSLRISSNVGRGYIEADVVCQGDRKPGTVTIRVPHPARQVPLKVTGGKYDPETETVTLHSFSGKAHVRLEYQ